jgi:hypothetical protein
VIAQAIRLQYTDTGATEVILTTVGNKHQTLQEVAELKKIIEKGKHLTIDIKQHRQKRSLDANGYCWVLCQKIAEVIGNTKEFVYKKAIREVGQFQIVPIKSEAVDRWIEVWGCNGIGWFAEVMHDSKIQGYKNIISYYGSSVYNTKEMSVLLEEIIREAKELNIETMTEQEKQALLSAWEGK